MIFFQSTLTILGSIVYLLVTVTAQAGPECLKLKQSESDFNHPDPFIDSNSCEQQPIDIDDQQPKLLMKTTNAALSFQFKPLFGFDYFEVRFLIGRSTRDYQTWRVTRETIYSLNKQSLNTQEPINVKISIMSKPNGSFFNKFVLNIVLVRENSKIVNNLEDTTESSVRRTKPISSVMSDEKAEAVEMKEVCNSNAFADHMSLSSLEIIVKGNSSWFLVPDPADCPNLVNTFGSRSRAITPPSLTTISPSVSRTIIPRLSPRIGDKLDPTRQPRFRSTDDNWIFETTTSQHRPNPVNLGHFLNNAGLTSETPPHVRNPFLHPTEPRKVHSGRSAKYSAAIIISSVLGVLAVLLLLSCCAFLFRSSK